MEQSSQAQPRRQRRPWTDEDQRSAEELRAQGLSYRAIGEALDRANYVVCRRLNPEVDARHMERMQVWRAANPEAVCEMARRWREANPEMRSPARRRAEYLQCRERMTPADMARRREQQRQWRLANVERVRKNQARWRAANLGKVRENSRRWREAHPERQRAAQRAWQDANPGKRREKSRRQYALRRAARMRALLPATGDQILHRFSLFGGCCAYCGRGGPVTVDHVLALNAGGLDEAANIVPACKGCNCSKRAVAAETWFRSQSFFTEARWARIRRHCPGVEAGQLPLGLTSKAA